MTRISVAIIGGGPGGLMAAERLSSALPAGTVTVYERKPSVARKFLMAGRGGLNLTHSEPLDQFTARYGREGAWISPMLRDFTPDDLRDWAHALGEETFIGSSGRVFPKSFKASPLLRAWQKRLEDQGVAFRTSTTWTGWGADGAIVFDDGTRVMADAVLLALGGASWPRLGTDGGWTGILQQEGIDITPLKPANSGFTVAWSDVFARKFAGTPLKPVTVSCRDHAHKGEAMITATGIEGGAVYAISRTLREEYDQYGTATLLLDLKPDMTEARVVEKLSDPRGSLSWSNYLRKTLALSPVATCLLLETSLQGLTASDIARRVKHYPLRITGTAGIERAISSAGGIRLDMLDDGLMLTRKPGVFACGEMLDWEAPTGGYLLQATFSTAVRAAKGMLDWIAKKA